MSTAQSILLGESSVAVAGGIESMSRMPYLVDAIDARWGHRMGNFTLVDAMDKSRVYTGNMDKDYLVLESVDPTTKDTYRWKMNLAAEGVRLIYTFDKKADGKTLFSNEYLVASSRAGESLGPKAKQERECEEHVFALFAARSEAARVRLDPREHVAWKWLSLQHADAELTHDSNREGLVRLRRAIFRWRRERVSGDR